LDHLPEDKREVLGIRSIEERKESARAEAAAKSAPSVDPPEAPATPPIELIEVPGAKANDAPLCYACGSKMQPAGSCYVCSSCGSTSGCS